MSMKNIYKKGGCSSGAVYGLGLVGSLIYFITTADSFGAGALGVLKSILWPAFLTFELFKYLAV